MLALPKYLAALAIVLTVAAVLARVALMRRKGIRAVSFGRIDRKDFVIPPFALFYFYLVLAPALGLPRVSRQEFFHSGAAGWAGVGLCLAGLSLLLFTIVSFGRSFRIGIDVDHPDRLVTTGAFALSRNPIYVAFWSVLAGQFLVFPNWIVLVYLGAASWLFHRQVMREEAYLREHYGEEYSQYCRRVRRYV
jgi:protein-S-isoprenylcysteine O-methyltransferase Ste14